MVGFVGGPVLGGVLIAWFWWGAVFLINVPIAVLAIVAAVVLMPESKGPWRKADPLGAVLSAVGMTALVWMIIELPHGSAGSTLGALAVAVLALGGFVVWELRTPSPMVPLGLFRARNFTGGSLSLTLVQVGNGGLLLVFTQFLQFVLGYSPTQAGLAFLPMAVSSLLFNTLGATLGQKFGNRVLTVFGLLIAAGGFGLLATASSSFLVVGLGLFVLGAGGGLAMPAAIAALMGTVPEEHAGVGSALNDTIQQLGAALGVAALGSVLSSRFRSAMPDATPLADAVRVPALADTARSAFTSAMSTTFLVSAVGVVVAAVVAAVVLKDKR